MEAENEKELTKLWIKNRNTTPISSPSRTTKATSTSLEELDRIETDQGRYVAVLPTFDSEEEMLESDSELIVLKVFEEGDETFLAGIEDDDEFDEVADIFEERLSDLFEIDVVEADVIPEDEQ